MPPRPRTIRTGPHRLGAARACIARHRRTALTHMLRGACYGIGTGLIGLAFMWVEQRLL